MLDIKRLRYLEAVYRNKNFTRASEELFVSQPAISAAISSLEKDLGITLIIRNSKKVIFTMEGEQFMFHVMRILKECDSATRLVSELSESGEQTLHLGMSPTLSLRLLPHLYSEFFPLWKNSRLHVDEGSMRNHIEKIKDDILDLSYNALPPNPDLSVLDIIPITTVQMYALMNPDHPLARYERLPIESLEGQPICLLDEKSHIRALMLENFEKKGIVPKIVSSHEQILCMYHMIQFGGYIGFSNADPNMDTGPFSSTSLAVRPFADPITFDAGFIMKHGKHLPKIANELISFTKATTRLWA